VCSSYLVITSELNILRSSYIIYQLLHNTLNLIYRQLALRVGGGGSFRVFIVFIEWLKYWGLLES